MFTCVYVGIHVCCCLWKPKGDTCPLPQLLATLFTEAGPVYLYILFHVCMLCRHTCVCLVCTEISSGCWSPGTRVSGVCEPPLGCWESNPGPLQEEQVLSTDGWAISPGPRQGSFTDPGICQFQLVLVYLSGVPQGFPVLSPERKDYNWVALPAFVWVLGSNPFHFGRCLANPPNLWLNLKRLKKKNLLELHFEIFPWT